MIAHLYPFVSICHLARCNNFIDDEGAIHLASALETGCAWTRHSFFFLKQRFKRGWDNPWSNSFERFEDVLVDLLWVRCTIDSVSSKWLCSCLEIRGRNPIPYFTDLDSISQQSKFHSTDPESKRWVSRLYQLVLRNSVGYNGKYHTDIVVLSQHYIIIYISLDNNIYIYIICIYNIDNIIVIYIYMLYTHNTSRTFFMGYKLPVDIMVYPPHFQAFQGSFERSGSKVRWTSSTWPGIVSPIGEGRRCLARSGEKNGMEKRSCEHGRLLKRVEMHMDDESIVSSV